MWIKEYFYELVKQSDLPTYTIEKRADIRQGTIARWMKTDITPSLDQMDRVLNVLGHRLSVVRIERDFLSK
jgi:predicted transcriptional regulator